MAEASIGSQRSFVKNLSRQSAQQIRESATATVKAMSEQVQLHIINMWPQACPKLEGEMFTFTPRLGANQLCAASLSISYSYLDLPPDDGY